MGKSPKSIERKMVIITHKFLNKRSTVEGQFFGVSVAAIVATPIESNFSRIMVV
jgi:hypothetical protein